MTYFSYIQQTKAGIVERELRVAMESERESLESNERMERLERNK